MIVIHIWDKPENVARDLGVVVPDQSSKVLDYSFGELYFDKLEGFKLRCEKHGFGEAVRSIRAWIKAKSRIKALEGKFHVFTITPGPSPTIQQYITIDKLGEKHNCKRIGRTAYNHKWAI